MEVVLKNLSKHFTDRKGNVAKALNDLDVTIPSGKLIGLLGLQDVGNQHLYLIAGLHKPTQGQIFW